MKTLVKCMMFALATFCLSGAYASTMQEQKKIRTKPKPDLTVVNGQPSKAPCNIVCPVTVIYDNVCNCFCLYGIDNTVVEYTIYDENEIELTTGTTTIINGTATIALIGTALSDGSTIELHVNGHCFVGTIEP